MKNFLNPALGGLALLFMVGCSGGCTNSPLTVSRTVAAEPTIVLMEGVFERTDAYLGQEPPLIDIDESLQAQYYAERDLFRRVVMTLGEGERIPGLTMRQTQGVSLDVHDAFVRADTALGATNPQKPAALLTLTQLLRRSAEVSSPGGSPVVPEGK